MRVQSKQHGLSLVELMLAMVIGLILVGGAIQIFISTKASYRVESALSRLQETGRFIIDTMAKEARMAGFTGCSSRGNITPNVIAKDPPPIAVTPANAILGYDGGGGGVFTPALPATLNLVAVGPGTDVVNIERADQCGAQVTGNFLPDNANVQVTYPNSCGFQQNQPIVITDCTGADIYQIVNNPNTGLTPDKQTTAHGTSKNTSNKLSKTYGPDSQVFRYRSTTFFLALGASGEPALWMSVWNPLDANGIVSATDFTQLELADGVADLQMLYGEDTGGGDAYADTYVAANAVTDWSRVKSVRVNLLLQSADGITTAPRSINFNGVAVNAGPGADRRLRMVYTATITIRNRLP